MNRDFHWPDASRPYLIWFGWRQMHLNAHRNDVCRLCVNVGPLGFRWFR